MPCSRLLVYCEGSRLSGRRGEMLPRCNLSFLVVMLMIGAVDSQSAAFYVDGGEPAASPIPYPGTPQSWGAPCNKGCNMPYITLHQAQQSSAWMSNTQNKGFCMDQVPTLLKNTGFAAKSSTNWQQCKNGGFNWCPLDSFTKLWDKGDGSSPIEYYYFSACCSGRQGLNLIADTKTGNPTCLDGRSSTDCKRYQFEQKLQEDLGITGKYDLDNPYAYDMNMIPVLQPMDPNYYHGSAYPKAVCICEVNATNCLKVNEKGTQCLWCEDVGNMPCHPGALQVQIGIQVFKLHTIDLQSSLMSFQAWIRQQWYDQRLSYDYQCYGGLSYFTVQGAAGAMENNRIWVPDVELVNNDEPIWDSNFPSRLAIVYSCWDGAPSRGGCGYMWWSRPGIIKALCKYGGLAAFPMDKLRCELEFSSWVSMGNEQDLIPYGTGVSWAGGPMMKHEMYGIVGGSAFQDYRIDTIRSRRDICCYPCCPDPFPTLIWEFTFQRSNYYYQMKLFIPSITLTFISFAAFWLDPQVGERLGYGSGVILAVITNDVVAMSMMPICDATVLMDYISITCFIFAVVSLLESCVVLNLYFRTDRSWFLAFMPPGSMSLLNDIRRSIKKWSRKRAGAPDMIVRNPPPAEGKKALLRQQLYKEVFFSLDRNHSGSLEMTEVHAFGTAVLEAEHLEMSVRDVLEMYDADEDGRLNFQEFTTFLECNMKDKESIGNLTKLLRGFIRASDREYDAIVEMWRTRAVTLDTVCRAGVPFGFFLAIGIILTQTEKDLEKIQGTDEMGAQWVLTCYGMFPLILISVLYTIYCFYRRGVFTKAFLFSLIPSCLRPRAKA